MGSLMLSLLLVTALCVFSEANGISKREEDKVHEEVVCYYTRKELDCESGKHIKIQSAMYIYKSKPGCPDKGSHEFFYEDLKECPEKSVSDKVGKMCNNKNNCSLNYKNFEKDECWYLLPHVEVSYTCIQSGDHTLDQ